METANQWYPSRDPMGTYTIKYLHYDINSGIEHTLTKFADDAKLSGVAAMPERQDATQRDLDKLEKGAHVNLIKFNKAKFKILDLGHVNHHYRYRLED